MPKHSKYHSQNLLKWFWINWGRSFSNLKWHDNILVPGHIGILFEDPPPARGPQGGPKMSQRGDAGAKNQIAHAQT